MSSYLDHDRWDLPRANPTVRYLVALPVYLGRFAVGHCLPKSMEGATSKPVELRRLMRKLA